ncbi:YDG/SRA domain-containing protein [Amycolatopsis minnesotensis]|uniref:HNH endonuclease n=1 Tax=Amycolatopsis minnesotensis TaxID=337894 RepID=A0ABP5B8X0_9PSEU
MSNVQYGAVAGVNVGDQFARYRDMHAVGLHRTLQAGIAGGKEGSDSIVVNGGYPDDLDLGDQIIYTGQGGRDESTRRQVADQELTLGNAGLAVAYRDKHPVRVIRGASGDPTYSPKTGYRYDGLFDIVDMWPEVNGDRFRIWRFHLVQATAPVTHAGRKVAVSKAKRRGTSRKAGTRKALVQVRTGQPGFRQDLIDRYGLVCAVTGDGPAAALQAAHLRAFSKYKRHVPTEGLLLRADIHGLFDTAQMTIDPRERTVLVHPDLMRFPDYARLAGQQLAINDSLLPDLEVLVEHHAEVTAGWP